MRDITFKRIKMKNFGPHIDPLELNFENNKMTMITGPNGIGKTMMIDAIPFALYGVTSKGARSEDVLNNEIGKNCKVVFEFEINQDHYRIERYVKYTRKGNTALLFKNGEKIKEGHKDVVSEIDRLIMPKELFMNTRLFGQKVKDFFTDLMDSKKKEIFRKIINLVKWENRYKSVSEYLKVIITDIGDNETYVKVYQAKLDEINNQIKREKINSDMFDIRKKESLDELNVSLLDNERLLSRKIKELENLQTDEKSYNETVEKIQNLESILRDLDSEYYHKVSELKSQMNSKIYELRESAAEKKKEADEELNKKKDELQNKISSIKDDLNRKVQKAQDVASKADKDIASLFSTLQIYANSQTALNKVLNSEEKACPTCKREIDSYGAEQILNKINEYKNKIDNLTPQIDQLKEIINGVLEKRKEDEEKLNSEIDYFTRQIDNAKEKHKHAIYAYENRLKLAIEEVNNIAQKGFDSFDITLQENKSKYQTKINELQSQKQKFEKIKEQIRQNEIAIGNIEHTIKNLKERINQKQEETFDDSNLESLRLKANNTQNEIKRFEDNVKKLEREKSIATYWKAAFSPSGIPSMLIDDSIPFMNKKVMKYLDKISNGRYVVSFDTLSETKSGEFRDKISVNVLDTHTKGNSRVQFSGGQTRLVDIATILTLGDLQEKIQSVRFNVLLFDEIFDSLDDENIGYVSKVLRSITKKQHIVVISHRHVDQLEADEILELGMKRE